MSEFNDFGTHMKLWRFKEIKQYIHQIMEDTSLKENDDWWRYKSWVKKLLKTGKNSVYASHILVFDELMSVFVPRTTKTGGLPNISYILQKPEPLGTEYKNLVDAFQGKIVWKEIQEGKERMRNKPYQNLGSTTACVMRGVTETSGYDFIPLEQEEGQDDMKEQESPPRKRLFYGDSWFGSVKTAEKVSASGNHCVMLIKTAHS